MQAGNRFSDHATFNQKVKAFTEQCSFGDHIWDSCMVNQTFCHTPRNLFLLLKRTTQIGNLKFDRPEAERGLQLCLNYCCSDPSYWCSVYCKLVKLLCLMLKCCPCVTTITTRWVLFFQNFNESLRNFTKNCISTHFLFIISSTYFRYIIAPRNQYPLHFPSVYTATFPLQQSVKFPILEDFFELLAFSYWCLMCKLKMCIGIGEQQPTHYDHNGQTTQIQLQPPTLYVLLKPGYYLRQGTRLEEKKMPRNNNLLQCSFKCVLCVNTGAISLYAARMHTNQDITQTQHNSQLDFFPLAITMGDFL